MSGKSELAGILQVLAWIPCPEYSTLLPAPQAQDISQEALGSHCCAVGNVNPSLLTATRLSPQPILLAAPGSVNSSCRKGAPFEELSVWP